MSNQSLTVQATEISSTQEWTTDPDMIEIYVKPEFLKKAETCVAFMQEQDISKMIVWWAFGYNLFQDVDNVDEDDLAGKDVVKLDDNEYVEFEPEYYLDGCHAQIFKDGSISAALPFKHTAGELYCSVGNLTDLKSEMGLAEETPAHAIHSESAEQAEAESICNRLLDSEEHAGEAAIPEVAEDAVEVINRLATGLKATQVALSQAMQHSEKAGKLVERIAGLSIWDYDKNDGTPYKECEEPGDGYLDSHCCLMDAIEEAREIQAGQ